MHTKKSNETRNNHIRVFVSYTSARIFRVSHSDQCKKGRISVARICIVSGQRILQRVLPAEPAHAGAVPVPQRRRGHVSARLQGPLRLPHHLIHLIHFIISTQQNHNKQMRMYYNTSNWIIIHFFHDNSHKKTGL